MAGYYTTTTSQNKSKTDNNDTNDGSSLIKNKSSELPQFMLHGLNNKQNFKDGNDHISRKLSEDSSFTCDNPQWEQVGLDLDGEAKDDHFGFSVALSSDENTLIVGAPNNDGESGNKYYNAGSVRVFSRNNTSPLGWTQVGMDIDGDDAGDWSGYSVAISANGEIIAVGAPGNGSGDSGSVKVFRRDPSTALGWAQVGSDIFGEAGMDHSGISVALSATGDVIIIGAPDNNGSGTDSGSVRVYEMDDTATIGWSQVGGDLDGDESHDEAGASVDISADGNVIAFGATMSSVCGHGYVKIFKRDPSSSLGWVQEGQTIVDEAPPFRDHFGRSISLSSMGNIIAIGGPYGGKSGYGGYSGHVRVYKRTPETTFGWDQLGQDIHGVAAGDQFGYSVALSSDGSVLAIGGYGNDDGGFVSGHTQVYKRNNTSPLGWIQVGDDIYGEAIGDFSGISVALSANGHVLAVGAKLNGTAKRRNAGHVRVFETACLNACVDDEDFLYNNITGDDCAWIGRKAARKEKRCAETEVKVACKYTCEMCHDETSPPSVEPTISPTLSPCMDNDDFLLNGKEIKSCVWIGQDESRRRRLCTEKKSVQRNCPFTCGTCCHDSPSFTFVTPANGMERDCAWIKEKNKQHQCGREVDDGKLVSDFCPDACNTCKDPIVD